MQDKPSTERIDLTAEAAEEARLGLSPHAPTERFIPVAQHELVERLTRPEVWPDTRIDEVRTFFKFLRHWRHLSYSKRQQELLRCYVPFSPDADTKVSTLYSKAELADLQKQFIGLVRELLQRANYDEIPLASLEALLSEQNPYGLDLQVDLSEFEELHIFHRGLSETTVPPSRLEQLVLRKKPVKLPIYQRLFILLKLKPFDVRVREIMLHEKIDAQRAEKVVARLRKTLPKSVTGDYIYIKLFKFIPRADLEMLFPNTRIRIRKMDKVKLGITAGGGGAAGLATTVAKLTTVAALTNPVTVGMALAGLGAVVFRQISSVFATRTQYMAQLSQSLYFHNLSNNHGVIASLSERGEEEDIKEEVLTYTLLARGGIRRSELRDAKLAIEAYLKSEFNVSLSFDINDALGRLERDGIVHEATDGTLVALPPQEAAHHIDRMWDRYLDEIAVAESGPSIIAGG